jgi:hypothetical protein
MPSTFVTVTTQLEVPSVPNFIRTKTGESMPIKDLTREQMEAIGKAWMEALIEKARRSHEADKKPPGDWGIKVPA